MSDLPTPEPEIGLETRAFWEATADGTLLVGHCTACGYHYHYPRSHCPSCLSGETELVEASGEGVVYSYTVVREVPGEYGEETPYVLAYVELAEGPRVLTNVVDCDPADVEVGTPVRVVFDEVDESAAIYRFTPTDATD